MVELFKVLGDENRLRIINLLIHEEFCVCEIEVILEMTQSNVSRHLKRLKNIKIISSSKDAQWIHYKTNDEFKLENELLFNYLKNRFKIDEIFLKDIERYRKYKRNNLNCKFIKEDREKVLNIIK